MNMIQALLSERVESSRSLTHILCMFIVAQKPSSDTHQWWNDPLEDGIKRAPSGNTNPFVGERTVESNGTDRLARSTTMPATRRPTPPPPSSIKKPVDLLGGKFEHFVNNL